MPTPSPYAHDYPRDMGHEHSGQYGGLDVSVSKVGGGTVGRSYVGHWHYLVTRDNGSLVVARGSDYECRSPRTHAEAAAEVADFLIDED